MYSSYSFRLARQEDWKGLVDLAIAANDQYKTRTVDEDTIRSVFQIQDYMHVEILSVDTKDVGFFSIYDSEPENGHIGHIFVQPGLERNGYGTLLWTKLLKAAKKRGWSRMEWISDPDACGFYEKKGATYLRSEDNILSKKPGKEKVLIFEFKL